MNKLPASVFFLDAQQFLQNLLHCISRNILHGITGVFPCEKVCDPSASSVENHTGWNMQVDVSVRTFYCDLHSTTTSTVSPSALSISTNFPISPCSTILTTFSISMDLSISP